MKKNRTKNKWDRQRTDRSMPEAEVEAGEWVIESILAF